MRHEKGVLTIKNKLFSFASNFIAGNLILAFIGYQLDGYFGTKNHIYLLIGIFLGFFWSIYETFKLVKTMNKIDREKDNSK